MKKSRIYTRCGDNGTTHLAGGNKVEKNHPRVEAYGTLDELNALLGILASDIQDNKLKSSIENIINNIFSIGCYLAQEKEYSSIISKEAITDLENKIDNIETKLPILENFILPIGGKESLQANLCRTVCRRAERRIVTLSQKEKTDPLVLAYINRLSDYLFSLSRLLNTEGEKKWEKYWK